MSNVSSTENVSYQFPAAGLRVLAIDNDSAVLEIIRQMCNRCHYHVILCTESLPALNLVRQTKGCVDVILMEVHMPNMDGYEFLQQAREEIDVPVILMSADDTKSSVMKAVKHGACDYWIKPLSEDQFKKMWTHVARKAFNENKTRKRDNDNSEIASSLVDATEGVVRYQNNSMSKEADVDKSESERSCSPPRKKPRIVWTVERHRKFVKAVNQIGHDKAVPSRILEVMNDPELTRENVASHLQKYRHFLKTQFDGVTRQKNETPLLNTVPGATESTVGPYGRMDFQALAATSHVPYETVAALHPEVTSNLMNKEDRTFPTMQWPNHFHAQQALAYDHPYNDVKNFPQSIRTLDDLSRHGVCLPSNTVVVENTSIQRNNVLIMDTLWQQRQQQQPLMHHQIHPINYQQSSLMMSGNPASVVQNYSFGRNVNYDLPPPQPNNSLGVVQIHGENNRGKGISHAYIPQASIFAQQLQNSGLASGSVSSFPAPVSNALVPYGSRPGYSVYQESPKNLGDGGQDTCIPTRSAALIKSSATANGFSNQNLSKDIDDNTTEEESDAMNNPEEEDHTVL